MGFDKLDLFAGVTPCRDGITFISLPNTQLLFFCQCIQFRTGVDFFLRPRVKRHAGIRRLRSGRGRSAATKAKCGLSARTLRSRASAAKSSSRAKAHGARWPHARRMLSAGSTVSTVSAAGRGCPSNGTPTLKGR